MIFEKLRYLIEQKVKKSKMELDQGMEDMCDQNCHLIHTIKKLYPKKLPMLECQINLMN
jgi:hypothetical protein